MSSSGLHPVAHGQTVSAAGSSMDQTPDSEVLLPAAAGVCILAGWLADPAAVKVYQECVYVCPVEQ